MPRNHPERFLRRKGQHAAALSLLLALASCAQGQEKVPERVIGLSSSLPLVWAEAGDIRGQLSDTTGKHWALQAMERRGRVIPLDTLAGPKGLPLPHDALLVLAQPRPLTPDENVALDAWVRAGGRLLLFADPMLTAHSDFALGDPRRPQDIAMLSPILRHWGLEMTFDPDQPAGESQDQVFGVSVPTNLSGRFVARPDAQCRLAADGIAADCVIGRGRAIIIADAAVFDGDDAGQAGAITGLLGLLSR